MFLLSYHIDGFKESALRCLASKQTSLLSRDPHCPYADFPRVRKEREEGYSDSALTVRECTTIESETFQSKLPPYISESSILTLAYEACGT